MRSPNRSSRGAPRAPSLPIVDAALVILAQRPHAAAELRRKLRQKGHEAEAIEAALTRLAELGYLDDAEFARALVGWRAGKRGRRAIAAELALGTELVVLEASKQAELWYHVRTDDGRAGWILGSLTEASDPGRREQARRAGGVT